MDLVCESRFGLNKVNWRFLLSGFAKVDPTCEAKVELVFLIWWLWLSFDLIHDLSILIGCCCVA